LITLIDNKELKIESISDLQEYINLASLFELCGWPKPGNVHRTKDFKKTRFEHYLVSITAVQKHFRDFVKKVFKHSINIGEDYSFVRLGEFFKIAARTMVESQNGGNTILGHLLILAPLAAAATICLKSGKKNIKNFIFNLKKVIKDATEIDTLNLYEAIRICEPGGLGKVEKYDINDKKSDEIIKKNKITLKKIFEISKDYDLIAGEYANNFQIILNEGLPYFFEVFNNTDDINIATVNTFLKILADHPDTLIIRKSGEKVALEISKKAKEILGKGGIANKEGLNLTLELDNALQEKEGKTNPGTTADLLTGVIFCALLLGIKI